jgi:transcriptional regulator with XRE-family HTH domain
MHRQYTTPLGELLRAARTALSLRQLDLAARVYTSARNVGRWETGEAWPREEDRRRIVDALSAAPRPVVEGLAEQLGVAPPAAATPDTPPRTDAELRAIFDAVVYGAAEERDVLPRHLRAFGVELLLAVAESGLSAKEAAALVAARDREKKPQDGETEPA